VEDWEDEMCALFEWVGMAGLGSQRYVSHGFQLYLTNTPSHFDPDGRLQANDRADAYVAVYEPPQSWMATVADVTRLRWRGFLGPDFVQSVIDAVLRYVGR
jgi:ribonuclease P/MRP protein subunit RPP40